MRKSILMIIAITICIYQTVEAQVDKKYDYSQSHHQTLRYGLFRPDHFDTNKLYPLIVYLHGSTDTLSRNSAWYEAEVQGKNPSFVLTPKCDNPDQGWGNTWNADHTLEMKLTMKLIDSLMKVYPIDPRRLYIYGISMGGFGVFSALQKEPGRFAAAYAVCGGSDVKAASKLLSTPLWIFHGDADDIVPVHLSRNVYNEMVKLGGKKVKYTEYPGVKHNSWENVNQEKTLATWLFSHQKVQ